MMNRIRTEYYKKEAKKGIENQVLQQALAHLQERFGKGTQKAYMALPEGPELRYKAHEIRKQAVENLDILLETLTEKIRKNGGHVYFAESAQKAVEYCIKVAKQNDVKLAVKGKSMVTEEINLNHSLMNAEIEVVETDLGEYIIQLAGEHPSHIIAPAIHKTRQEIGRLFSEKLNIPYTDDPPSLTQAARSELRKKFLSADMGISGCNIACAETGHITTVSNEGNIRMASTLPRIHIVFMGMERVIARLEDHDIMFRLLSRGAAAQNMATYVSYIGGPRTDHQLDGPEAFHLVILDNGRAKILADEGLRESLFCIRCAACLNVCPVYGKIGGHAYGYPYSGPVGAVVTPLLTGITRGKDLCLGETLCGACRDACPINIDIPRMLLELRTKLAEGDTNWQVKPVNKKEKILFSIWSLLVSRRSFYEMSHRLAYLVQSLLPKSNKMIKWLPVPLNGWTKTRDLKPFTSSSFTSRWKKKKP